MKIEPKRNLKKPAYAIGMAVLTTTLLTGCPGVRVDGMVSTLPPSEEVSQPTSEFVLDGDMQMIPTDTESIEPSESGQDTTEETTEETTEVFILDGETAPE